MLRDQLTDGDVVLQEIWRIKDELSAERGHHVHRLFAGARQREKRSGLRSSTCKPSAARREP
jgi:hypothetical protein